MRDRVYFLAGRVRSIRPFHLRREIRPNRIDAPKSFAALRSTSAEAYPLDMAVRVQVIKQGSSEAESEECSMTIAKFSIIRR
jgi:hypothetical protein